VYGTVQVLIGSGNCLDDVSIRCDVIVHVISRELSPLSVPFIQPNPYSAATLGGMGGGFIGVDYLNLGLVYLECFLPSYDKRVLVCF